MFIPGIMTPFHMLKSIKLTLICFFIVIIFIYGTDVLFAQQLAFPSAEGFGRFAAGGRGGVVYEVANLSDAGTGSLRYGIESISGARTIVFKVSGTIELTKNLQIKNGNLTIAGQTAPGDGICIKNSKLIVPAAALTKKTEIASYSTSVDADNVIIRYVRFRPGDEINNAVGASLDSITFENDGLWGRYHNNVIIDHCSMSWAIDEASSFYDNTNFTMQWCLIGESLYHSFHSKGNHGYGGIWGGMGASFHHNLIADNTSRNPRFCGARYHVLTAYLEIVDFRNNVIFNWGGNSIYGGEGGQYNIVNNYYKPGPATIKKGGTQLYRLVQPSVSTDPKVDTLSKWYLSGNYMEGNSSVTSDNINGGGFQPQYSSPQGLWEIKTSPIAFAPVYTQSPVEAFESVLTNCGASLARDTVDKRIINQARTGVAATGGTFGANTGIIDNPASVGSWPVLNSTDPPADTDHDGMPDNWENQNGLNPNDETDRNNIRSDGYTQLEAYLNNLIGEMPTYVDGKHVEIPKQFVLHQNYPNPFNPVTNIEFLIPNSEFITLKIFDIYGREVAVLIKGLKPAGSYLIQFDGNKLASGIYFAQLSTISYSQTIKLILAK
jgi:pectate lyase